VRVVIADDEPLVRSYVRSLVCEALSADATILEAADGKELADIVLEGRADVAFVDIRMPKMDGFAALDAIRVAGRRIPWFVLSSHSDFAYAKRALELGALGYALKPPAPDEIRHALSLLVGAAAADRAKRSEKFEHDWTLFVVGGSETPPDAGRGARYAAALIVADGDVGEERVRRRAEAVARAVAERGRRFADFGLLVAAAAWGADGEVAVAAGLSEPSAAGADAALRRFWNEAAFAAETGLEEGGRARPLVLVADAGVDAAECRRLLSALRTAAKRRALLPSGTVGLSRAEEALAACPAADIAAAEAADAVVRCLRSGDGLGLADAAHGFLAFRGSRGAASRFLERFLGEAALSGSDAAFLSACEALGGSAVSPSRDRDTIAAIEEYVRKRYAERIGVEGIARSFGLTPNYLSALFHKRTGSTLVRYLTEVRLMKARELLRGGLSVKEAAWEVGYGSERHFARLYRERFGHAPAVEKKNAKKT
jgi:two-component system response regulator YesN